MGCFASELAPLASYAAHPSCIDARLSSTQLCATSLGGRHMVRKDLISTLPRMTRALARELAVSDALTHVGVLRRTVPRDGVRSAGAGGDRWRCAGFGGGCIRRQWWPRR